MLRYKPFIVTSEIIFVLEFLCTLPRCLYMCDTLDVSDMSHTYVEAVLRITDRCQYKFSS
jgi:hypothetical protein